MKKIGLALFAAAALFTAVSCTSTGSTDSEKQAAIQEAINDAFDTVYASYSSDLVLDGAETYTVQPGDRLTSIAKKFYGDDNGYYFPLIMLASRDVVKDPEFIKEGMELTVPQFDANIKDKEVAKTLSAYFKDVANVYKKKKTEAAPDIRQHLLEISAELAK